MNSIEIVLCILLHPLQKFSSHAIVEAKENIRIKQETTRVIDPNEAVNASSSGELKDKIPQPNLQEQLNIANAKIAELENHVHELELLKAKLDERQQDQHEIIEIFDHETVLIGAMRYLVRSNHDPAIKFWIKERNLKPSAILERYKIDKNI